MLLLYASTLILRSFIFAFIILFITFSIFSKICKKLWLPTARLAFLLLIVLEADHPRIKNRGTEDSTFVVETTAPDRRDFKITAAFCDMKNMEHPRVKRLLLMMLIET